MRKLTLTKIGSLEELAPLAPNVIYVGTIASDHPDDKDEWMMVSAETDAPVVKTWKEPGDTHGLGASATVRGSLDHEAYRLAIELEPGEVVYCVEWDDLPGKPVFCRGKKLARAE